MDISIEHAQCNDLQQLFKYFNDILNVQITKIVLLYFRCRNLSSFASFYHSVKNYKKFKQYSISLYGKLLYT